MKIIDTGESGLREPCLPVVRHCRPELLLEEPEAQLGRRHARVERRGIVEAGTLERLTLVPGPLGQPRIVAATAQLVDQPAGVPLGRLAAETVEDGITASEPLEVVGRCPIPLVPGLPRCRPEKRP